MDTIMDPHGAMRAGTRATYIPLLTQACPLSTQEVEEAIAALDFWAIGNAAYHGDMQPGVERALWSVLGPLVREREAAAKVKKRAGQVAIARSMTRVEWDHA